MARYIFLLVFLAALSAGAQNLVRNPGFELKTGCPDKPGDISDAQYWVSPNRGTPDYFNDCSPGLDYGTEFNKKGGRLPHSGHAYAGLQFYNLNRNEFFEYIQTMLDTAMTAGKLYCISAWVSLGKASYAVNGLGAVLSATEIRQESTKKMQVPAVILGNGRLLSDGDRWMCIHGLYRARGNEKLLTIGDLSAGDGFRYLPTQAATDSVFKSTYYFIDDVSVETVQDSTACKCIQGSESPPRVK